jgi:autotransporter translocation and assembly factor TamB
LQAQGIEGQQKLHATGQLPDVIYVDEVLGEGEREAAEAGGTRSPLALAVSVKINPLRVRTKELDVQTLADLKIHTDEEGRIRLRGKVAMISGWVTLFKHRYDVRRANVLFRGQVEPDPVLDVLIARRVGGVDVMTGVEGPVSNIRAVFRSEPAVYSKAEVMNIVLTGRTSARSQGDASDQSSAIASSMSQILVGSLLGGLSEKVGIDVLRVDVGRGQGKDSGGQEKVKAGAELGKYVTDWMYLGYRRVFGADVDENENEFIMEIDITDRWMLMGLMGEKAVGGLDVFWNYRY